MKKQSIAIIGASYLQRPLIEKALQMGLDVHVFAWRDGADIEGLQISFHPISIRDIENIAEICEREQVSAVISVASDLAAITVNEIANRLDLVGNSPVSSIRSTDKARMREALASSNIPQPRFVSVAKEESPALPDFDLPYIVKPTDRSGSRGVTKATSEDELLQAIELSRSESFSGSSIIEEFMLGDEISVEMLSKDGVHIPITITDKVTTGPPRFTEKGHQQPSRFIDQLADEIYSLTERCLDALDIKNGASHTELKVHNGEIKVVEVGGRMGGDLIGTHIVPLSTGYDFTKGVIEVSLGKWPSEVAISTDHQNRYSGISYFVPDRGEIASLSVDKHLPDYVNRIILLKSIGDRISEDGHDLSNRTAVMVYSHDKIEPPVITGINIQSHV